MRTQIQSLASFSRLGIQHCHELWCRPAAAALIQPRAWELPYATSAALNRKKKKREKKEKKKKKEREKEKERKEKKQKQR